MNRFSKLALTIALAALTTGVSACGRRTLTPPQDLGKMPQAPYVPPSDPYVPPTDPYLPPADPGMPPADPGAPPADPGMPPADPGTPPADPTDPGDVPPPPPADPDDPTDPGAPPADPGNPPADPPPAAPPQQPASDPEFWSLIAKMGFTLPKDEFQRQVVEASQRVATSWSKGREGDVAANIAKKFADNQKYFVEPPATAEEYAQRALAFANRNDANTSYYIDLRYSLKGGGGRVNVLKFDQMTFEVLSVNASNQITWYTQWKGMLKLPSYLFVPPSVYQTAAPPAGDTSAQWLRRRF